MEEKYVCYCGLYCENCAVKAKIDPAARVLYDEMKRAGFEDVIHMIPGGDGFWPFLKSMAETGTCTSCRDGGGNPGCKVRICAREKGVEVCARCEFYPCELFGEFFKGYPVLEGDNALLRDKGMGEWGRMQDERKGQGFTYQERGNEEG